MTDVRHTPDGNASETSPIGPRLGKVLDHLSRLHRTSEAVLFDRATLEMNPAMDQFQLLPWSIHRVAPGSTLNDFVAACDRPKLHEQLKQAAVMTTGYLETTAPDGQVRSIRLFLTRPFTDTYGLALVDVAPFADVSLDEPVNHQLRVDRTGVVLRIKTVPLAKAPYKQLPAAPFAWCSHLFEDASARSAQTAVSKVADGTETYLVASARSRSTRRTWRMTVLAANDEVIVDLTDTTADARRIAALERSRSQLDLLSEALPVGAFVVNRSGEFEFQSQVLKDMLGGATESLLQWTSLIHPDDQDAVEMGINKLTFEDRLSVEARMRLGDEKYAPVRFVGQVVRSEGGVVDVVVGFIEDLTESSALRREVERAATVDDLTSLPNRFVLDENLRTRLDQPALHQTAVLFVDLDGFKLINDTQGHGVGDQVLLEVAQRFRRAIRPRDLVARFGGDEFVVVASRIDDVSEALAIARRLHDVLATPVVVDGRALSVGASVGIALADRDSNPDQLIGDADIAMYEAKAAGPDASVIFDTALRARASQRFDMTSDLRHAGRRREFVLDYQPIVRLEDRTVVGAEALIRWQHPTLGRLLPPQFVGLAEEIGLIGDLGNWVLEQTCADLSQMQGRGLVDDGFIVSINASASQFTNVDLLEAAAVDATQRFGVRPQQVRFELTESVPLTEIPQAARNIERLSAAGFSLAIDDFGTGYSSLAHLTMLKFDVLKLDLSLTAQLKDENASVAVVASLTALAASMGFDIVAEGIESEDQLRLLAEAGVKFGQGYLLAHPLPIDALAELLA